MQYSIEHDERLRKRAPLFFSICLPGLTDEYKMSVFYQCSNQQGFALRIMIVTQDANANLHQKFDKFS